MSIELDILHIDMDAYFASIEQRDNSYLKGLPVIISGNINKRSVVSTCSYEAREYGIRSSMPTKTAYRLCPNGVFIFPRFEYYKSVSKQIKKILLEFTDKVEMFSLDEAYLDISNNKLKLRNPLEVLVRIKERINRELGLTCSIGLSFSKFLAKIGSDYRKPNGITVIGHNNFENIIDSLEINKIYGIGNSTAEELKKIGVKVGKDLKQLSKGFLFKKFGVRGVKIFENIRGIDDSKIVTDRVQKSFSNEITLENDIEVAEVQVVIRKCAGNILNLMNVKRKYFKTITLKIKFSDFSYISRQITCKNVVTEYNDLVFILNWLICQKMDLKKKIRLIGVKISNLIDKNKIIGTQLGLFSFS